MGEKRQQERERERECKKGKKKWIQNDIYFCIVTVAYQKYVCVNKFQPTKNTFDQF